MTVVHEIADTGSFGNLLLASARYGGAHGHLDQPTVTFSRPNHTPVESRSVRVHDRFDTDS